MDSSLLIVETEGFSKPEIIDINKIENVYIFHKSIIFKTFSGTIYKTSSTFDKIHNIINTFSKKNQVNLHLMRITSRGIGYEEDPYLIIGNGRKYILSDLKYEYEKIDYDLGFIISLLNFSLSEYPNMCVAIHRPRYEQMIN